MESKLRNSRRVPVREAKNQSSELLRRAARGEEIVITSHGEARARLTAMVAGTRPLQVDWQWLRRMRVEEPQTAAEALIRVERDSRD